MYEIFTMFVQNNQSILFQVWYQHKTKKAKTEHNVKKIEDKENEKKVHTYAQRGLELTNIGTRARSFIGAPQRMLQLRRAKIIYIYYVEYGIHPA